MKKGTVFSEKGEVPSRSGSQEAPAEGIRPVIPVFQNDAGFCILHGGGIWMDELFRNMGGIRLAEPWWLLLLPAMACIALLRSRLRSAGRPAVVFPGVGELRRKGLAANRMPVLIPPLLRWSAFTFCTFALAAPVVTLPGAGAETAGIDIVLALDISESMQKPDFEGETRLSAVRSVARRFILQRPDDRIGLVLFSGKSFTQCPLTLDHKVLLMLLDSVSAGSVRESGTAIGTAILTATNRLRPSGSGEKALLLLTDGENNAGEIPPVTASRLALQQGIRIYAIFAGRKNGMPAVKETPVVAGDSLAAAGIGRGSLEEIAGITGGAFFSATDHAGLERTFRDIDRIEKTRLQGRLPARRAELFPWLLLPAVLLLAAETALSSTRLTRIP
jgi:Ca-activated chloride channel family protein